jgi:hypothetical protein
MRKYTWLLILCCIAAMLIALPVNAQSYYFNLQELVVDVFLNADGTATFVYRFTFQNDPSGATIEYVDVAYPSYADVNFSSISADVEGVPVTDFSESDYQGSGQGVAVGLGALSIPPGETGTVNVTLGDVRGLVFQDSQDENYASFEFSPAYFDSSVVYGLANITVQLHLPPGVEPDQPRWHVSPSGWQEQPDAYLDEQGRVTYVWSSTEARADKEYQFGASIPKGALPAGIVRQPDVAQALETDWDSIFNFGFWACCIGMFALIFGVSIYRSQRRRLQYLPPKIAIEGHGIKRGLTAVEAAILLEQPLDKILTMMLFSTIKKGAATVTQTDPLKIKVTEPYPESLQPYEMKFLQAFKAPDTAIKRELQNMMVDLVKELANKMKGFSRKETLAYYKDIVNKAWLQVEAASTPEVKSEKFSEEIEWTMLDDDYDQRTRRVFGPGPVITPTWWPRYDPTFSRPSPSASVPGSPTSSGGGLTMPSLPGATFAGSIVSGVQNFSRGVVGNIGEFTGAVASKTNPVPVSTTRSSGGGSRSGGGCACACACACAGCACACAGGGR